MTIIEKKGRKKLAEGRTVGLGFSLLKKNKTTLEGIMPFTTCKDYLNDVAYVENSKNPLKKVYGFKHKLLNLFDNKKYFYMNLRVLDSNSKTTKPKKPNWKLFEETYNQFQKNKENIIKIINLLEKELNKDKRKTILFYKSEQNTIIKAPIYWFKTSYAISLYTFLLRIFINSTFEEGKDFKYHLNNIKPLDLDKYLVENFKQKYKEDKNCINKVFEQDFNNGYFKEDKLNIHNAGFKYCFDTKI